ncbi:hypothetical protein ATI61_110435 [Archangium gephyra]|uniref:Uncharacterized protein n=1 Tax=Archangium gephyra TaxID=48 RepID=A0AAC8QEE3_9BACT|nr:hypothetical protein [Archangium gephyra]AKJ05814.1 Hypothetical protein AA314_07440 [Archangium gephyra]REG27428.1 hypothetical protein ATI61_110435 [Archangium gephyra]
MSKKQNANEEYPLPTEPPELVAKREKLLAALEKQAKTATGTAQPVLRKMHELVASTKVGVPLNANLYNEVKEAFVRFTKDPVLPPPTIIMEVVEFMQERLAAVGFTGQMEWPEGAPPVPAGFVGALLEGAPASGGAPAAPAQRPAAGVKDGFEGSSSQRKMTLNPETAPAPAASTDPKSEQQQLESFKTWMKNPALGKVKG